MPCSYHKMPDGTVMIVRRSAPRPRRCTVCQQKHHKFVLCDYELRPAFDDEPLGGGQQVHVKAKTCDVVLCEACAVHVDPDLDYCPLHAATLGIGGRKLRL